MIPAAPLELLQVIPRLCAAPALAVPVAAAPSPAGTAGRMEGRWHFLVPRIVTALGAAGAVNQHGRSTWKGQIWDRNWEYLAPGSAGHSGVLETQSSPGSSPGSAAPQGLPCPTRSLHHALGARPPEMPQPKDIPASLQQQNSEFRPGEGELGCWEHSRASLGADTAWLLSPPAPGGGSGLGGSQQEPLGFEVTPQHSPPCRELGWAEPRAPAKQNIPVFIPELQGKGPAGLGLLAKLSILQSAPGHQLVWDV